jgi:hypothetical protein
MTYGDSGPGIPPEANEPGPAAAPQPAPAAASPMSNLGTGEMLIALGALVIAVLVDLIGNVLLDEWSVSFIILAFAYLALALLFLHHFRSKDSFAPYDKLLVFTGYATGVFGVREILDVLDSGFPEDAIDVLFELAVIGGCALMAFGAYMFSNSD